MRRTSVHTPAPSSDHISILRAPPGRHIYISEGATSSCIPSSSRADSGTQHQHQHQHQQSLVTNSSGAQHTSAPQSERPRGSAHGGIHARRETVGSICTQTPAPQIVVRAYVVNPKAHLCYNMNKYSVSHKTLS